MVDNCNYIINRIGLYTIPHFAALWCGVCADEIHKVLNEATIASNTAQGRQILKHQKFPCLEARCMFICNAIVDGTLVTFNEQGNMQPLETEEHSAWDRKRIRADKAIEWLQNSKLPIDQLPRFLFQNDPTQEKILNATKEKSYKIILYSILKAIGKKPFETSVKGEFKLNRSLTGWVKTEIEKIGFSMDDDTIRGILKGLQSVEVEQKPK